MIISPRKLSGSCNTISAKESHADRSDLVARPVVNIARTYTSSHIYKEQPLRSCSVTGERNSTYDGGETRLERKIINSVPGREGLTEMRRTPRQSIGHRVTVKEKNQLACASLTLRFASEKIKMESVRESHILVTTSVAWKK